MIQKPVTNFLRNNLLLVTLLIFSAPVFSFDQLNVPDEALPIMTFGCPQPNPIRVRKNHVISYDTRTKIPYWVYEKITKESLLGEADRKFSSFKADDSFKPEHRSELSDYRRSGFDRGHMAPAGNNKYNQESMDQTFILSNIAPQIGIGFNRHIWRDLEMWIRDELKRENTENTEVHIITGPMFVPNEKM